MPQPAIVYGRRAADKNEVSELIVTPRTPCSTYTSLLQNAR